MKKRLLAIVLSLVMVLGIMPQQVFAASSTGVSTKEDGTQFAELVDTSNGIKVSVAAPKDAFPDGTTMSVEEVTGEDLAAVKESVEENLKESVKKIQAVDITFWSEGKEIQPNGEIEVKIESEEIKGFAKPVLVHMPHDEKGKPETVKSIKVDKVDEKKAAVSFKASKFSVYAIVEPGDDTRLTVNFVNGDKTVTVLVKPSDITGATGQSFEDVVYDPSGDMGIAEGETFCGWTTTSAYTVDTEAMDIEAVRDAVKADLNNGVQPGDEITFYAKVIKAYHITYLGDKDILLGSVDLKYRADAGTPELEHEVEMTYIPDDSHNFEGWLVRDGGANIKGYTDGKEYKNGETITVTGSVTFAVDAPLGNWLVFDENGKGAKYNAPRFIKTDEVTAKPCADSEMTRYGYTFTGWYTDAACTTEFTFGGKITEKTTIYAGWTPAATANYSVIIWKQSVSGGDNYDFERVINLSGNVGDTISTVVSSGSGDGAYATINNTAYRWTGFHLDEFDSGVEIVPEGTSIVNVYYNRNTITLKFYTYSNRRWNEYRTLSGLYGSTLASNNYTWPTEYDWYANGSNNGGTSGTHTTFLDAFLPSDGSSTVNFYGRTPSGDAVIIFYKQNAAKTGYEEANRVTTSGSTWGSTASFSITDKYNGFEAYQYSVDNGRWQNVGAKNASTGVYGSAVPYDSKLEIRFNRLEYTLSFLNGVYVSGEKPEDRQKVEVSNHGSLKVVENVTFGASLASYNVDGADYYIPNAPAGYEDYVFAGWYADEECTTPYTFSTMTEGGVTVYAKWIIKQYRVFLHPEAGTDSTLDWGSDNQAMNFRITSGGKVSLPNGLRNGYELVGWYTDKEYKNLFNADAFVLNDTTVTTPYDKTKDMTDIMDKWGNGATTNSDITGYNGEDRFWITKKLDLYARWRATLDGADGIGIVYDANGGSNPPTDSELYVDQAYAVAGVAPKNAPEGKVFDHWVVQTWNETSQKYEDTDITVLTGGTFEVLKANAKCEVEEYEEDGTTPKKATYTVQLKAVYRDKGEEIPTHIDWYKNDGTEKFHTDKEDGTLKINEAVAIQAAQTRTGYKFLGWAKVDGENPETTQTFNYNDIYLFYGEDGKFHLESATGTVVTQVAADEKTPIQSMFAVWAAEVEVIVEGSTKTVEYNGEEQSNDVYTVKYKVGGEETTTKPEGITLTTTAVQDDETLTTIAATGTDAGTYTATVTAAISTDSKMFIIKTAEASDDIELIINPVEELVITITGNKAEFTYDGTEKSASGYTATSENDLFDESKVVFNGTAEVKRTEAGTYPMGLAATQFSYSDTKNFKKVTFNVTDGELKINPVGELVITITGNKAEFTYDGTEKSASGYTATSENDLFDESKIVFSGTAEVKGTNAGTYPMGLAATQFSYSDTTNFTKVTFNVTDGELKINPVGELVITITGNKAEFTYDGTEKSASGYTATSENDLFDESKIVFSGTAEVKGTNAGTYPMGLAATQFSYSDTTNFTKVTFNVTDGELKINPVDELVITITGNKAEFTYDGTEKSAEGYTATSENDLFDESKIVFSGTAEVKGTNAGTYPMGLAATQFSYSDTTNFTKVTFNVTDGELKINPITDKVTVTITENADKATYDGKEHTITGYASMTADNDLYDVATSVKETKTDAWTVIKTDAGTYDMGIVAGDFANTNTNFSNVEFKIVDGQLVIDPKEVTVTVKDAPDVEYDGKEHEGIKEYTFDGIVEGETGTITYTAAKGTLVGEYTGSYADDFKVTKGETDTTSNYKLTTKTPGKLNIIDRTEKFPIEVVSKSDKVTYDGKEHTVEGFVNEKLEYEFDGVKFHVGGIKASGKGTNVGTYPNAITTDSSAAAPDAQPTVFRRIADFVSSILAVRPAAEIKAASDAKYVVYDEANNDVTDQFDVTLTEGELEIEQAEVTVTITGNKDSKVYNGKEQTVEDYTVKIDNELYTEKDFTFSGEAVAKGTDVDKYPMGLKEDQFKNTNDNFKVTFVVTDGELEITPVTDEVVVTVTEKSDEVKYDGKEHTIEGYETIECENELYDVTKDVKETKTDDWTVTETYVGEFDMGIKPEDFENTNKNFANVTFKIVDGTLKITDDVDDSDVIVKKHEDKEYKVGDTVKFTITVTNIYAEPKTITVEEIEGVKFTSDNVFKDVEPGKTVTVTAEYVLTEADIYAGTFKNTATAKFSGVDKEYKGEDEVPTEKADPHLTVVKEVTSKPADGKKYAAGEKIEYKITVKNDGNLTIEDIEVSDDLTGDKWTVKSLAPGEEKSFTTSYTVTEKDAAAGKVVNKAAAKGHNKFDDKDTPNDPGTTETPTKSDTPKTGDTDDFRVWGSIMAVSMICMIFLALRMRKGGKHYSN